jgi:hypothetical protein
MKDSLTVMSMVKVDQESDQGGKFFSCYLIVLAIGCNNVPPVPLPNQPVPIRFFVGVDPSGAPTNSAGAPTKSAGAYTETHNLYLGFRQCHCCTPFGKKRRWPRAYANQRVTMVHCGRKKDCSTRRCKCRREEVNRSVACRGEGHNCGNLSIVCQ